MVDALPDIQQAVDATGTLLPPKAKQTNLSPPPPNADYPDTAAVVADTLRATFVAQILSVPLLPSRLGANRVDFLLKERTGAFVDCLEGFRLKLEASRAVGRLGDKEAFCLPPSSVSCCSTETFLLGNMVDLGTKLPFEGGVDDSRRLRVFMQTVTSLLELKVSQSMFREEKTGGVEIALLKCFASTIANPLLELFHINFNIKSENHGPKKEI